MQRAAPDLRISSVPRREDPTDEDLFAAFRARGDVNALGEPDGRKIAIRLP